MVVSLNFPPLDQSLLFTDLVNFHMERNPSVPIFVYADEDTPDVLTEISFLEFGRAAHRVAYALRPSCRGSDGEVVMIIANTDTILYHAIVTGLSVARLVPFPVSPRNSVAAVVNMMKKTGCSRIVTLEHVHRMLIDGIRREFEGVQLTVHELPTFRSAFPSLGQEVAADPFTLYPPSMKRPDLDSPAIYIHSSGSTGFPKAIPHSHRIQIQWMAHASFRLYAELASPRRVGTMALPAFHSFAVVTQLYMPFTYLTTAVVYAPRAHGDLFGQPMIPTSDNMIEILKRVDCNVLMTVPAFLEQMATSDESIEVLKKTDFVTFGGGPLAVQVGQKLTAAGVRLSSAYGGTEFGVPVATTNLYERDMIDGDWMWVRFPDSLDVRWAPQGDDTYELQLLSSDEHRMAIENLPDANGYATADVFVKHPTKDMWQIVGRADDVIILASGEKTVPAPMESIIGSSPLVQGVVMFGRERNQVGVLIEPRHPIDVHDEMAVVEFRRQIWSVIEEANQPSPAFSRIFKEMILITSEHKPMSRAPKGTVQRKATLREYETEINTLYDTVEASAEAPNGLAEPSAWTTEELEEWLDGHARVISPSGSVDPHVDLFAQGFDSLSATYIRNRIIGALRKSSNPEVRKAAFRVPSNVVFENPTLRLLSARIAAVVNDSAAKGVDVIEQHRNTINAMIEKYSVGLNGPVDGALPSSQLIEPSVVLLTGSTGGLGSFLLSELLKSPAVQRVFAFNRPSSIKLIQERQKLAFKERSLPIELLDSSKLVYVEADASMRECGLSPALYEEIRSSVTLIIHNAWRLDFNMAISSFEDSIRASRNLVDLGLDSPRKHNLRFVFTSSIGSAQSWDRSKGPFPEEVQLDPCVAVGAGYGESKYATERIIVKSGLHATSLRIGQIVGGRDGSWATTDWFPILVKSSVALGALPEAAGVVSWLREEEVARAVLETAFAREAPPPALNIVNPRSAPWNRIMDAVRRAIVARRPHLEDVLQMVPFGDWCARLEKRTEGAFEEDLVEIPAIKLLEFFRVLARGDEAVRELGVDITEAGGMSNFSTEKAREVSATMANTEAIGEAEADTWVKYWISKGAL